MVSIYGFLVAKAEKVFLSQKVDNGIGQDELNLSSKDSSSSLSM